MKLIIIKTPKKDFCVDISKTIYSQRYDLIFDKDNNITDDFYNFLIILIDKNELGDMSKNQVIYVNVDDIKDPTIYIGMNLIKFFCKK